MLQKTDLIKVKNRGDSILIYKVPDLGVRREFAPGEIKEVTYEEIQKLSYTTGGKNMLEKYLIINSAEAIQTLLGDVEPEYYYTKKEVVTLLTEGSYAQLADCLDFAEDGVIELVQSTAVEIELNDMSKRELIQKKTGFNVTNAIMVNRATQEDEEAPAAPAKRRAAPISTDKKNEQQGRRTAPPEYKVTSMGNK